MMLRVVILAASVYLCELASNRITYVGHATVLIDSGGTRVLTDPVLRSRVLHISRRVATPDPSSFAAIDAVLLSHLHADHFDPPSLRLLGSGVRVVAPAGAGATLARHGLTNVTELGVDETATVGGLRVTGLPAAHDGRRVPVGRSIPALGYLIDGAAGRMYFAGDTAPFDGLGEIADDLDLAFLPIAGWGPKLPPAEHLDPTSAAEAAAALGPRIVVPIHWGTFLRLGIGGDQDELLQKPVREFTANLNRVAPDVTLRVLAPGESMALDRAGG